MVYVKKEKGESDEKLINRFRKKVINSGVILEYRDRKHFKKKSEKRKEQKYRVKHQIEIEKKRDAR